MFARKADSHNLPALLVGVVGAAYQGTRLDVTDAQALTFAFEGCKFVRRVVARDGKVVSRGPQVLADGGDINSGSAQVAQHGQELVERFAQTHHEAGFGGDRGVYFAGAGEEAQSPIVAGAAARHVIKPGDRLRVVIEHVRTGGQHDVEGLVTAAKVWDQHFHSAARNPAPQGSNGERKNRGSAVFAVVAIYGSHHDIAQPHHFGGARHSLGLVPVNRQGAALGYRAEGATPGAQIPQNHESGGTVFPALADIGATGAFADRVQTMPPHRSLELMIVLAAGQAHLQPVRPGQWPRRTLDLNQFGLHLSILLRRVASGNRGLWGGLSRAEEARRSVIAWPPCSYFGGQLGEKEP